MIKNNSKDFQLEIERKYLVEVLKTWTDFSLMMKDVIFSEHVEHNFVISTQNENLRISEIYENYDYQNAVYVLNKKNPVNLGTNEEFEKLISSKEYYSLLNYKDQKRNSISKTRLVISNFEIDSKHKFEFDLFEDNLLGLAILEVELKDINEKINFPNYFKIKKDVTSDSRYSNFNLALKNTNQFWK
jgi:CYTH domain-containing protein